MLKPRYSSPPQQNKWRGRKKSRTTRKRGKTSKVTLLFIILVLIAFVIGAGIGISMALGAFDEDNEPHFQNVTHEMTDNLSKNQTVFDYDMDTIDYNNKSDIEEYNITYNNDLNY